MWAFNGEVELVGSAHGWLRIQKNALFFVGGRSGIGENGTELPVHSGRRRGAEKGNLKMVLPFVSASWLRNLWALLLPVFGCAWFAMSAANAESLDDLGGIVRVEHTRSFSDVDRLAFSVLTAPPVVIQLSQGSSPSQLIKQNYGFGASDSPEAYGLMESRILKLNGVSDPTRLPAGNVLIPDLPILTSRSALTTASAGPVVRNSSPVVGLRDAEGRNLSRFAYSRPIKIDGSIARSLTYTRLDRYSAIEAAQIIAEAAKQNQSVVGGIEAGIQLAASQTDCTDPSAEVLSAEERTIIKKALGASNDRTERYLIVLDTGWPTFEDQVQSLQSMRHILDAVRSAMRLPESALPRFDAGLSVGAFVPISHAHACMVSRSLREFTSLDKDGRIKVIFLPLRPGQAKTRDLFREIIELDQLITALGGELFARSPSEEEIRLAKEFSSEVLEKLPALREVWAVGDDVVRIYEPLISGQLRIFDTYARITPVSAPGMTKVDARFWLSLSWNFTKFAATPSLPSSGSYMVFVAAGNDRQDFVVGRRLFASEAASGRRVFAVMNNDEELGTLTCNSAHFSTLWDDENSDSNIGSFPGRLGTTSSQPCPGAGGGTSFSTPRLAWLSAASDVSSRAEDLNWPKTLSLRLLKSREKVERDPSSAPIRIGKLFASR